MLDTILAGILGVLLIVLILLAVSAPSYDEQRPGDTGRPTLIVLAVIVAVDLADTLGHLL